VGEFSGVMPPEEIRRFLDERLPRSSDSTVEKARAAAGAGNVEQALQHLRDALERDPENYRIHPEAAALLIELDRLDEAESVIKSVPANLEREEPFSMLSARIRLARLAGAGAGGNTEALREKLAQNPQDLKSRLQLAAREALAGECEASMDNLLRIIRQDRSFGDDAGRKALLDVFSMLENRGSLVRKYRSLLSSELN
jgi:putative thioredoxin